MINNRLLHRTAGPTSQGGFTLVELLVVIGIIAILAGVALGPITSGIKKAKQSTGMQTARSIALSEFSFSNDNNSTYPDTKFPVTGTGDASDVAKALLNGSYISDASVFYISGGTATKYTGTTPATGLVATNISWDFMGATSNTGITSNAPDSLPVIWSSVAAGTGAAEPSPIGTAGILPASAASTNPYGIAGMAVCFKSNSAKFIIGTPNAAGTASVVNLTDATYPGYAGAAIKGGG